MSREPSMEEILSSIRRVIARDDAPQGVDIARKEPVADPVPQHGGEPSDTYGEEDDDILELTDAEPVAVESMDDDAMTLSTPADGAAPSATRDEPAAPELVSQVSAAASRQSLDALAAALAGGKGAEEAAPAPRNGELSVNALVEAALRPMLKNWLDAHLPHMVERLVAREIARITGERL